MDSAARLRASGLRVTRQRLAVLEAVGAAPHASAAEVLKAVTATLPEVSHQAVYDGLADLTAVGRLRRILIDGGPARYETRTRDNHHHFVCRACGEMTDVDCAAGSAPCLGMTNADGFIVDEAEITYRGLCARCAPTPLANVPADFPPDHLEETIRG